MDLKIILSYLYVVWGVLRVTESARKNVWGAPIANRKYSTCWIFTIRNPAVWGGHRGQTCDWSADYHVKRNHIQSESDLTEDGSITNRNKHMSWCSTKAFGHYHHGTIIAGEIFFLFSNVIYFHLYISPGLMFCFLVILQDLCILFISKLYLVLL